MVPAPNGGGEYLGLRLADDEGRLLETQEEREASARAAAEARVRELEEQLCRLKG